MHLINGKVSATFDGGSFTHSKTSLKKEIAQSVMNFLGQGLSKIHAERLFATGRLNLQDEYGNVHTWAVIKADARV